MVMVWLFKCKSPCMVKDILFANLSIFHISIRQEEIQEGQDLWEETISCLLSSGDVGIGLVWDNHLIPYNISVWILKFCSNYLWWVLSCSQNDVRCFQLFHRCFQMFLDVFGVRRMLSRCVQMITNVGRWIFSRSSLGVLLMFSGCSQDFSRMFWRVLWAWWVWGVWSLSL